MLDLLQELRVRFVLVMRTPKGHLATDALLLFTSMSFGATGAFGVIDAFIPGSGENIVLNSKEIEENRLALEESIIRRMRS